MKMAILTVLTASLIVASAAPIAMAAERHQIRKADRASLAKQFRKANDAIALPVAPGDGYSSYGDLHAISAPAER
jgi:hypothetical protein